MYYDRAQCSSKYSHWDHALLIALASFTVRRAEVRKWMRSARPTQSRGTGRRTFDQTAPYIDRTIAAETYESIREWVTRWFGEHQELLRTRVIEGRIRDGHGDIRAESICVTDGLCIFDCIEFNERSGSATLRVRFVRNGESSSAGSRRS